VPATGNAELSEGMSFPFMMLVERARPQAMTYPEWASPAVINIAERLCAQVKTEQDPAKALDMLSRLTSDERMRPVWTELYKKKRDLHRPTETFHHPACVSYKSIAARCRRHACKLRKRQGVDDEIDAKVLEMEADGYEHKPDPLAAVPWSEQDIGVQLFFWHTYRKALNCKPEFLSDLQRKHSKLKTLADHLRKQAGETELLGEGQASLAQKLAQLASEYDDAARQVLPKGYKPGMDDDPWIITRRRSTDPAMRSFVVFLSIYAKIIFDKELHTTLAHVTNVVFDRHDMTRSKVRELLRLPSGL
jgi:hypothetical protein